MFITDVQLDVTFHIAPFNFSNFDCRSISLLINLEFQLHDNIAHMFSKKGRVSQIGVLGMAKAFRFTKVLNI